MAGAGTARRRFAASLPSSGRTSEDYATATPKPRFDIVSYHYYPALAERCAPADLPQGMSADRALSEDWLARPDKEFLAQKALRDRFAPRAPMWLTETGGAACGGLRWQPTFLDLFRFTDTHARLARQGLDAMFTHALISGSNGVIDEKTFQPNASYWSAVLWKRLMGSKVLDAGAHLPGLHLYAHCQRGTQGGVTLLAINLEASPKSLGVAGPTNIYALTASNLESTTPLLNGRTLVLGVGDTLPAIDPVAGRGSQVTIAPHSVNYITLPKANSLANLEPPARRTPSW